MLQAAASPRADRELAEAADRVLERRDEERGIDSLTAALVHFLDEAGGLTDDLVLAAAHEGEIAFVAEVLARRAGIANRFGDRRVAFGRSRRT